MKRTILVLITLICLAGCGHTTIQKKYMQAQQKVAALKAKQSSEPLATIETPDGYTMTIKDPRRTNVKISPPQRHPAVGIWEDTVGLASSPLASALGFGFAGKMLMEEAGAEYSAGGDITGHDKTVAGEDMASGDINNSVDKSDHSRVDKSDNSKTDNSVNDSYNDKRQNYNNDHRSNYNNKSQNSGKSK